MRIRRVPGRVKLGPKRVVLPQRTPVQYAPKAGSGPSNAAWKQTIKPPDQHSPHHPESQMPEFRDGLFKYSTPLLSLTQSAKLSTGIQGISWKLYSRQPLDDQVQALASSAIGPQGHPSMSGSTLGLIRWMYTTTFGMLRSLPGLQNTYLHVFGSLPSHPLATAESGVTIGQTERNWQLVCQLYGPKEASDVTSRPWFKLRIPVVRLNKYCTLKLGSSLSDSVLQIAILGHLKSALYSPDTEGAPSILSENTRARRGALGAICDDIVSCIVRKCQGRTFDDVNDLLSLTEESVLTELRKSAMMPLLDFAAVQLELKGADRSRWVRNTLLNADGTLRHPDRQALAISDTSYLADQRGEDVRLQQTAEVTSAPVDAANAAPGVSNTAQHHSQVRGHVGRELMVASGWPIAWFPFAQQKLEINGMQVAVRYCGNSVLELGEHLASTILQRLEHWAETVDRVSLAALLSLCSHIAQWSARDAKVSVHPQGRHRINAAQLGLPPTSVRGDGQVFLTLHSNEEKCFGPGMRIQLPQFTNPINTVQCGTEQETRVDYQITLFIRPSKASSVAEDNSQSQDIALLITDVAKSATSVAQHVLSEMKFEHISSVGSYLAEALLRVLKLEDECADLTAIKVKVSAPSAAAFACTADAYWTYDESDLPSAVEVPEKRVNVVGSGKAQAKSEGMYGAETAPASNAAKVTTLSKTSIPRIWQHPELRSSKLQQLTGFEQYGYVVTWKPPFESKMSTVTSEAIESVVEEIIRLLPDRGLVGLQKLAAMVAKDLPLQPQFSMILRDTETWKRPGYSSRLNLWQYLMISLKTHGMAGENYDERQVEINLPEIHSLRLKGETEATGFIGVKLVGSVCSTETGADSSGELLSELMRTLEKVADIARSVFAEVEAKAISEKLARSAVKALAASSKTLVPHFKAHRMETRVGVFNSLRVKGRAVATIDSDGNISLEGSRSADDLPERNEEAAPLPVQQSVASRQITQFARAFPENTSPMRIMASGKDSIRYAWETDVEQLERKTGSSSMVFTIYWPKAPPLTDRPHPEVIHQLIEAQLSSSPDSGLGCFAPLRKSIADIVPSSSQYGWSLASPAQKLLDTAEESLDIIGQLTVTIWTSRPPDGDAEVQDCPWHIRISSAELRGLPFAVRQSEDETAWFGFILHGTVPSLDDFGLADPSKSSWVPLFKSLRESAAPVFSTAQEDADFDDLDDLAHSIGTTWSKQQDVLPASFKLEKVEVRVGLRHDSRVRGRASIDFAQEQPEHEAIDEDGQALNHRAKVKDGLVLHIDTKAEDGSSVVDIDTEAGESQDQASSGTREERLKRGVFIALGSNVGDRLEAIEAACQAIDEGGDMHIVQTSPLYETAPMYVEDQARFLNGVCEIETQLQPLELLDRLQAIEKHLGRVKTIDKGPRSIDLDILLYRRRNHRDERLTIPHTLMHEREFVLRPLSDIMTHKLHPFNATAQKLLSRLGVQTITKASMFAQTPLAPGCEPIAVRKPDRPTKIMSILNVTPDSFSDGGSNTPADVEALKSTVAEHVAAGATIIDVGGQSSRPNAPDITAEEEIARILPAIEAIKSLPEATGVAISVDTYRATVAEAAVKAGAHIVNDISAGLLDPEMLPTVARLGCTYIMMHMRGTPATMQDEENCSYPDGVIPTIASELRARIDAAQTAGIRRWRIILDPGVGFAKTQEQNSEVLRELGKLRTAPRIKNYPWLVGSSRKGFIGKITGVQKAKDRSWGTAATVTAAVHGGADIVRVHDVKEMAQVAKMADAMYRV